MAVDSEVLDSSAPAVFVDLNKKTKTKMKKDKAFQTKVVIRRLPPSMTEEQFVEQLSPLPDYDYLNFVKADMRLGQHAFSRAYINFLIADDIFVFKDKFDGYVFLDSKGGEYPAVVEFSPFQKIPKKRSKKKDAKCGTIINDPDYIKFLESMDSANEVSLPSAEAYLEEIENREKEMKANNGCLKVTTPLIEYLKARKLEQQKIREEKREERKRKELEKKRVREEERRRRRAEKDKERIKEKKEKDSFSEKDATDDPEELVMSDSPKPAELVMQVLKNPEREKDQKEVVTPQKTKEFSTSSKASKDKPRREWERVRPKEKQKVPSRVYTHEKYPYRREKTDYKLYNNRKQQQDYDNSSRKNKEIIKDSQSFSHKSSSFHGKEALKLETAELRSPSSSQSSAKDKVDTSCHEETESSITRKGHEVLCGLSKISKKTVDCEERTEEVKDQKDQRSERRIRNKDRPSLEIYRPGMKRFSTQRSSPQKEISSNSSSPCPSPPSSKTSVKSET